jgi:predicted O-methyltransferase YrrM
MKKFLRKAFVIMCIPITYLSAVWLKFLKNNGTGKINEKIFMNVGLLPLTDHYYQPLINPQKYLTKSLRDDRKLPGLDFNVTTQLELLNKFSYNNELIEIPLNKTSNTEYYYNNGSYCSGDAEFLYNIIRYYKPSKIIEIGSGFSTLMALNAIGKNKEELSTYNCKLICIEPYEQPWLEKTGVEVIREKAENLDPSFFYQLQENEILFIDSSHIIRPQGDVLFEYQEILPLLNKGVLVHVHDIFTPKDYLDEWILKDHLLWNEQYLLESFLTYNSKFKIIGALNFLSHNYRKEFEAKCPVFSNQPGREPGAFWMLTI